MSFGWSAGDVIAGLKVVWDIWEAVSDGPLNAKYQASQFFDEFYHIISRLDDWEKRKAACAKDDRLVRSHRELRDACTVFIKKHFALIQESNPGTRSSRTGRSTWLQKASFTRGQILTLYQQVQWPMQREHVGRLREKLQFFLNLAAWDVALDTNDIVRDIRCLQTTLWMDRVLTLFQDNEQRTNCHKLQACDLPFGPCCLDHYQFEKSNISSRTRPSTSRN
jgi:hypothetical protein